MQLLETVSQDIKAMRDYTPCAPEWVRWVVVGGYLTVLLSAAVWGLLVLRERTLESLQNKDKIRLQEIVAQINIVKEEDAKSQALRDQYEQWTSWLKGNYSLSKYMGGLFAALPEGARLQELDVREAEGKPGAFALKMRFFAQSENRVTSAQELEERLTQLGVDMENRQQSVTEGGRTEVEAGLKLPAEYYPVNAATKEEKK